MQIKLSSLKPVEEQGFRNRVAEKIGEHHSYVPVGNLELLKVSEPEEEETYALIWHNDNEQSSFKKLVCRASPRSLTDFASAILEVVAPELNS